ncbi:MAG: ImmA/IrrE family metallo-endopeptidase [Polyangiaceae bacterium]
MKGLQPDDLLELETFATDLRKRPRASSPSFPLKKLEPVPDTVRRLREHFEMTKTAPTPILELIAKFGLEVRFTALDALSGALVVVGEDRAIGILVNSDQPQERQRFSAAHELAHFVLGHSPQGSVSFLGRRFDRDEVDADTFAGELLVPTELLAERIEKLVVSDIEVAVLNLARMFTVSFQAMTTRLAKAGALRPDQQALLEQSKPSVIAKRMPSGNTPKAGFSVASLPQLAARLMPRGWESQSNRDAVRLLQEQAVFSYFADVPEDRAADSAGKVYELVALWVAERAPVVPALG